MSNTSSWANIVARDAGDKSSTSPSQQHRSDNTDQHDHPDVQHPSSNRDDPSASGGGHASRLDDFPLPQETVQENNNTYPPSAGVGDLLNQSTESVKTVDTMDRSYAFVSDFPLPQEASSRTDTDVPASAGVGELLHTNEDGHIKVDTTIPPHPDRSFASVAGNKDFPDLKPSTQEAPSSISTDNSLSDLPDVKEMLASPSVKIPPPPPSQSFAKMAAKPAPVEETPGERVIATEKQNAEIAAQDASNPAQKTHENFPTLAQSNMMAEHGASSKERDLFTEISKLSQSADATTTDEALSDTTAAKKTFADVTNSHLDEAPPSAASKPVNQHPVYDEETVMNASARRETRKWRQKESGEEITPEMEHIEKKHSEITKTKAVEEARPKALEKQIQFFDKRARGKITLWDTFHALRQLGYWWFTAIPTTILLHLRLSPPTSPHGFPFIYRSLSDIVTLPIYTNRIGLALATYLPLSGSDNAHQLVRKHGSTGPGGSRGIGFWAGLWGLRDIEGYRWWQVAPWHITPWFAHRVQWFFVYTMLQDPISHLVTEDTLSSLLA